VLAVYDELMAGWAWWSTDSWRLLDSGGDYTVAGRAVLRPWVRAVAGVPQVLSYDVASRTYRFTFDASDDIEAPSEVWVPASQLYGDGWHVEVAGPGSVTTDFDDQSQLLRLRTGAPGSYQVCVAPADVDCGLPDPPTPGDAPGGEPDGGAAGQAQASPVAPASVPAPSAPTAEALAVPARFTG
jgi:Glycoside hydrolase family 5 C-terminal domain